MYLYQIGIKYNLGTGKQNSIVEIAELVKIFSSIFKT